MTFGKTKVILSLLLVGLLLSSYMGLQSLSVEAKKPSKSPTSSNVGLQSSVSPVVYKSEDTVTGGDWKGIISGVQNYGKCGHILPNAPVVGLEVPMGTNNLNVPIGDYMVPAGTDSDNSKLYGYGWTYEQVLGYPLGKQYPAYYDEYVPGTSGIVYKITGTLYNGIQYPGFEFAWSDWHNAPTNMPLPVPDPKGLRREVYYETTGKWKYASWDDGGERCFPNNGYFDVHLFFPRPGNYTLSLYAYDLEGISRWSEMFQIWDATKTNQLAFHQITNNLQEFYNGVYESFRVTVPVGGLAIIVEVYNDAGHGLGMKDAQIGKVDGRTNNVVLSGIFVDCEFEYAYRGATPGFWKNNIGKQTNPPIVSGTGIQIPISDIIAALRELPVIYPTLKWLPTSPDDNQLLLAAYGILDHRYPDGTTDATIQAESQILSLLLSATVIGTGNPPTVLTIGTYGTHSVDDWIALIIASPNLQFIMDVTDFLNNYNHY